MRRSALTLLTWLLIATLVGCSRVQLAYNHADFLLSHYAGDYLGLTSDQLAHWEPRLERALATHRHDELPYLAAYFDRAQQAARMGFPSPEAVCLVNGFRELYVRQARFAVDLAAPLLAGLDRDQVRMLRERFARDYAWDRPEPSRRDASREKRKRAKRWISSIEDWTGKLKPAQRSLVAEMTGQFPDTGEPVFLYRTRKRSELITRLESGADETELHAFLTTWLVEYRDLPPDLGRFGESLAKRVSDLLSALGQTLDQAQRQRLDERLSALRKDFLKLQVAPRMAPLGC